MPRNGMYKCNWTGTGSCNFEGIHTGFEELLRRLDESFHMDEKLDEEEALIEYYDRTREDLRKIGSQEDFETALRHSAETYSPFSLVVKVNAKRREEFWYNGEPSAVAAGDGKETVRFGAAWRVSKPKFTCIREWLIDLEQDGKVCRSIDEACSYGEKAFLYAQFSPNRKGSQNPKITNHIVPQSEMDQSIASNFSLASIKESPASPSAGLELLEPENQQQKMLHEKMMMDPVISLVLFNEYIPLRAPARRPGSSASAVCEKMGGLFLGKSEESGEKENKAPASSGGSIFMRSELPPPAEANKPTSTGGLFLRSTDETSVAPSDDWVIA